VSALGRSTRDMHARPGTGPRPHTLPCVSQGIGDVIGVHTAGTTVGDKAAGDAVCAALAAAANRQPFTRARIR
jgi:hypothetical protein